MKAISVTALKNFSVEALIQAGLSEADANTTADVLVTTDTFGVLSHGTKNLYQYILKMQAGGINPKAVPTVETEGPAWAVIDGNAAIGMVTACKAMNLAIEKAKEVGIAYVGVRNSCHFGAAGYYANMAASQGMMGLSMSNGDPVMSIPNASGVVIGNNPFSFAVPLSGGKSVFLDVALSNVAALKVVMAKEKGISVPSDWLVDEEGRPTTDPSGFPGHASLQPMAAHKGYGFAIMVETLASVLTGAGMLSEVVSWNLRMNDKNNVGHAFLAIDVKKMMAPSLFEARMDSFVAQLHAAPKAAGKERIFVPGEMEWEKREKALKEDRLELTDVMADNMEKLAAMENISLSWLE